MQAYVYYMNETTLILLSIHLALLYTQTNYYAGFFNLFYSSYPYLYILASPIFVFTVEMQKRQIEVDSYSNHILSNTYQLGENHYNK